MQHHERLLTRYLANVPKDIDQIVQVYRRQAQLCDGLEAIADGLPEIDSGHVQKLRLALVDELPMLMAFEECVLLPVLDKKSANGSFDTEVTGQIKREHLEDLDTASHLYDMLGDLCHDARSWTAELAGFQLRAFFAGLSRHLCWECRTILPGILQCAGPEDLERMQLHALTLQTSA